MSVKPAAVKPAVYKAVAAGPAYAIERNGKPLQSPRGSLLSLPTEALATAIAEEWRAQKAKIDPTSMPLNQLAATTIDLIERDRTLKIDELLRYIDSEQLCHRAEHPQALIALQEKVWQPLLDWAAAVYGAEFSIGSGIMPIKQPPATYAKLRQHIEALDGYRLSGLLQAAALSGSLVIALALAAGDIDAEVAIAAAELDSHFQMQRWGEDPDILKRQAAVKTDLADCQRWFSLLS